MPKHHEYVGDVDYRPIVRQTWDSISLYNKYIDKHHLLMKTENPLPYVKSGDKNSNIISDCYNHVIGLSKDFPIHNLPMQTESAFKNVFEYKLEYERVISVMVRKAATLYSLHDSMSKYGKFNDPICVLYDEHKDIFHVCLGQQRYYYSKVTGTKLDAIVYSMGVSAANKINSYVDNVNWDWQSFSDQFYFDVIKRSTRPEEYNKSHLMLSTAYDSSRDSIMKEHQDNVMNFVGMFISEGEEVYYYHDDVYLFFIPNEYAKKKVKVNVKDEFGIIQHILWRYCDIENFAIEKRFEINEL